MRTKILLTIFVSCLIFPVFAGTISDPSAFSDTLTVVPGAEYEAGAFYRFFLGSHWRSLWTSPVKAPVINLHDFAGGLSPIKRGGGFQTKSLHFKGHDGKYYKFRSLNKDPSQVLPPYLRKTFVADVVQDQISTSHPFSAFIVSPLLNAVGVLNAEPVLVILPDDSLLGAYREEFKNVLGTFAENPKDDTEDEFIFAGADKVINDYEIFEKLEEDNKNQVDAAEYLKARLMDIFLGDWDRHVGQWQWARFSDADHKFYRPIPRDRDQAFSRYDGVFPYMVARGVTQIEHFSEDYPQINDLTWSGRHLDRRFLTSVDRKTWDSVATFIYDRLTDEVIEAAVRRMPETWFAKEGFSLIGILKYRRDHLPSISQAYYKMIFKYVSVYASDKAEYAQIHRIDDRYVEVSIFDKNKRGVPKPVPFYHRIFKTTETKEIRIDLLGGDDTAVIDGHVNNSITLRIVGGNGRDELIDSSQVDGYFLAVTPFPDAESKTFFYDSDENTRFTGGPSTCVNTDQTREPKKYDPDKDNYNEKYEPQTEDRGHDWKAGGVANYNSDDGIIIGGGPVLYEFGFRAYPYVYRMELIGAYATTPKSFRIHYSGEFYSLIHGWRVSLDISKTELGFTKFYGFGNGTQRDEDKEENDFYQVGQQLIQVSSDFEYPLSSFSHWSIGTSFRNSELYYKKGSILDQEIFRNLTGLENISFFGLHSGYLLDTRDHTSAPEKGVYLSFYGSLFPRVLDNKQAYGKIKFRSSTYLTTKWLTSATIALQIGAEKIWGNYPLFDAAFIGGEDNIRGFNRERFSGSAAALWNAEWRIFLFPVKIVIPARFGFTALIESGRVFYPGENSNKWHAAYGGGLWITLIDRIATGNFTLARSSEVLAYYFSLGFMF